MLQLSYLLFQRVLVFLPRIWLTTQGAVISSEFQRRLQDVEQVFFKEKDLKVEQGSAEKFLLTLV